MSVLKLFEIYLILRSCYEHFIFGLHGGIDLQLRFKNWEFYDLAYSIII